MSGIVLKWRVAMRASSLAVIFLTSLTGDFRPAFASSSVQLDPQKMHGSWSPSFAVEAIRIGRPTNRLEELKRFYGEGLGLKQIGGFNNHQGFTGVLYGLPGAAYHLEFTQEAKGSPGEAPSHDNNLVLYLQDKSQVDAMAAHLEGMGYHRNRAVNPYWEAYGATTIVDPDGWNVVLMPAIPPFMQQCCSR